MRNSILT